MGTLLQQVVNGLVIGSSYTLVAVGFTLIFGVLRVVYLAHGAVLVAGAYLGLFALQWTGNSVPLAVAAGAVGGAVLGALVELVALRPVRGQNHLLALVTTISVGTILQETLRLSVQDGQPISYPDVASGLLRLHLGGIELHVTEGQAAVVAVSLALVGGLGLVVRRSWFGRSIRAVADAPVIASILGVRVNVVSAGTVALASALAGVAGVLLGLTVPAIDPYVGEHLQFKALAIVLFGGLGSVAGAVLGGMLLGLVEAIAAGYLATSYRDLFAFAFMVLVLAVRPAGLLGRRAANRV